MAQLDKDDLKQMNRSYFQSLSQETLVEVADNLHQLATELWEKQQQNSENSSQPPSLDNPYSSKATTEESSSSSESESTTVKTESEKIDESVGKEKKKNSSKKPGKQPGGKGFGRSQPLKAEVIIPLGSRRKEELSHLVTEAFLGWLITDGYAAYRSHPKRQRCLAHLIRKAIAISGAINSKAAQIGQWILDDLRATKKYDKVGQSWQNEPIDLSTNQVHYQQVARFASNTDGFSVSKPKYREDCPTLSNFSLGELIATIASASEEQRWIRKLLARLRRVCHLGKKADHTKLQALAKEILNDWDAVVAFVNHPELPPTNNEAERALRHAVIARNIGYGTRTSEGSLAYSSLLSVIETCRLREINPGTYIASILALARQGLAPPPFPVGS